MSNTSRDNFVTRSDSERSETQKNNNNYANVSSRPQQSDGSTTIRRTLVEHGIRPAGATGDNNLINSQSSTIAAITTIARQHEDEQRELQELNAKFSVYLDRVQYLEDYNKQLSAELNNLRQTWGGDAAQLQASYGLQLKALRDAIDNAIRDQTLQELQLKRSEYDLWQVQQQIAGLDGGYNLNLLNLLKQELDASNLELEQSKNQFDQRLSDLARQRNIMENLLNELDGLKNELDNQQIERVIVENELQTLREHAAFQDAIYQAQREEILTLDTPVLDVSGFYRAELARAISDIRQDFEVLSQSQVHELEEYYRVKTEQVRDEIASENERKRLLASEGVVESMDKVALSSSLKDNQNDFLSLQAENKQLQTLFDAIVDDLEKIQEEHLREKQSYDYEFAQLREDIEQKKETIDSILENNVSLRFEMTTYRHLLDGEEKHLNKMEQGSQLQSLPSASSSSSSSYRTEQGPPLQNSPYQNQQTPNGALNGLGTKKMTVQKTARGPISFESVDLETDSVILINEKYSGSDQSFRNWTIRRQLDQQPELVYQFPSTFSLRPRQTLRILSKLSSQSARITGDTLVADKIETWGQGRKMITRLIDDNNEEKAIITQVFQ